MIEIKTKSPAYLAVSVVIAIIYFAAAEFGLSLASVHTNVSPVWPPTGVAIAALLLLGRSFWPAILAGALGANLLTNVPVAAAAGIAVGNTLEALTAWYLLKRVGRTDRPLDSIRGVLRFVLFAVLISPAVSATIGNLSLCLTGAALWSKFAQLWVTWWLGDGFGALVIAPLFLSWFSGLRMASRSRVALEGSILLVFLFLVSMLSFGGWLPGRTTDYPIEHLCLPFLVWAALRFDLRVLGTAILLLAGVAVWGTSRGYGPFIQDSPNESLLLLQLFIGSTALTTLVLHAVTSERKRVEEEKLKLTEQLQVHRQRVADIVAHVPGVVWEAWGQPDDASQRIDFVSDYVEVMLGYSREEWLSTPNFWLTIVHPEDREAAGKAAARKFATGEAGSSRFRWVARDGHEVWVEAHSVVVFDAEGKPVGMRGVTMDITPAVRAEQERVQLLERERKSRTEAEEANRLKDEFLATVSHELRTPLNAIFGWSRLLNASQLDEKGVKHALEVIERNARVQKQIIEDLLDVSRIITGKLRVNLTPVDLLLVIPAAIDVIRPGAESKQINIQTHINSPDLIVRADADRLQQIAWNLLSNAVKFTPTGGSIEIFLNRDNSHAEVRICDNGPGIPAAFLPRIFERFSQADGSSTRKHGGLGLGLAIVRHLVELHGGTVEARNRAGQSGAELILRLPVAELPAENLRPIPEPENEVLSS